MPSKSEESGTDSIIRQKVQLALSNPGRVYKGLFYVGVVYFVLVAMFPFYWLLVLALTPTELIRNMGLVPKGFNPGAFVTIFQELPLHVYIFNSFVIGIMTTAIILVLASLAGYVFGRLEFRGKAPLLILLLVISFFPPAAYILPLFRLLTGNIQVLGISTPDLFNTPGAMVVPLSALFLPLSIFILTNFYGQIPDGLEDAARIEGTSRLGALYHVIVPLSAPGLATAGVLTFISVYNEFFFSFLMTDGQAENWAPLLWGVLGYQTQYVQQYNLIAAASIVGVLPVAIIVVIAQEKIVSGLTAGALKE